MIYCVLTADHSWFIEKPTNAEITIVPKVPAFEEIPKASTISTKTSVYLFLGNCLLMAFRSS